MDDKSLETILSDWSFWDADPPGSVARSPRGLPSEISSDLVLVVQGVRRCGKSTFLTQLMERVGAKRNRSTFVNFEDPRLSNALGIELLDQIEAITRAKGGESAPLFLFLDEIQNVPGWEKWLHLKTARPKSIRYVVTGSNSRLLSGDLSTALTGRHVSIEMFPFDFGEFQQVREGGLEDYLEAGGFPRVLSYQPSQQLLAEYFTDIVERDVRRHVRARDSLVLRRVFQIVFESVGAELSARKLAAALDIAPDSANEYLSAGLAAYIAFECPYFTYSERKRAARNRKFYAIDTGLRRAITTKVGRDLGKDFENAVYLDLRRYTNRVFYWRGRREVDFVIPTPSGILPIQVTWGATQRRHELAIDEFREEHPEALPAVCVTAETYVDFLQKLPRFWD